MTKQTKRRNAVGFITLAVFLILSGCWILSFHPLYFEDDLIFDISLLGDWETWEEDQDEGERWTFLRGKDQSYRLIVTDENGVEGEFDCHLLRLDDNRYLDLFPREPEKGNEFHYSHLAPCHSFLRIDMESDELRLRIMDFDWLNERLKDGRIKIAHTRRDDGFILTATTKALQKLIRKYADEAFSEEAGILKRIQE